MYSRVFDSERASATAPKNYNGTFYRPPEPTEPAPPPPMPEETEAEETKAAAVCAECDKCKEQPPSAFSLFDIKLNTEDLLLLGMIMLLAANGAGSDIIILLAIIFAVGII